MSPRVPRPATLRRAAIVAVLVTLSSLTARAADLDVFERPVPFGAGRPTVLLLANRDCAAAVGGPLARMSFDLRDLDLVVIVRVDLRGIPSLLHGFARSNMRGRQQAGIERFKQECAANHVPAPDDIGGGLYFVAEPDGEAHRRAGLARGFPTGFAIVYDGEGHEVARGPFPQEAQTLAKALRERVSKGSEAAPTDPLPEPATRFAEPKASRPELGRKLRTGPLGTVTRTRRP